ncbi:MAG: hypothetical protein M0P20_00455 [Methanocorpusculum sp.]|nr:hypothetical protein [Methanocorpusculum sp.]
MNKKTISGYFIIFFLCLGLLVTSVSAAPVYLYNGALEITDTADFRVNVSASDTHAAEEVLFRAYSPVGMVKALGLDYSLKYNNKPAADIMFATLTDKTGRVHTEFINVYKIENNVVTERLNPDMVLSPGDAVIIQIGGDKLAAGNTIADFDSSTALFYISIGQEVSQTWPIMLSGVFTAPLYYDKSADASWTDTRSTFLQASEYATHKAEFTDGTHTYTGVKLRLLAAIVDDIESMTSSTHFSFNTGLAAANYRIQVTDTHGSSVMISSSDVAADHYILADKMDGGKIPVSLIDVTKTGDAAILLEDTASISLNVPTGIEQSPGGWSIEGVGRISTDITDTLLYRAVGGVEELGGVTSATTVTHNLTWTDKNGDVYYGIALSTVLGWLDDFHLHGLNTEALSGGYTILLENTTSKISLAAADIKDDRLHVILAIYKQENGTGNLIKIKPFLTGTGISSDNYLRDVEKITLSDFSAPPAVTSITVKKITTDGTIISETSKSWEELRTGFDVIGDGKLIYAVQGPVMNSHAGTDESWDVNEEFPAAYTNARFKVEDTVKGTSVKDLVDLVGGMDKGDLLRFTSADGVVTEFVNGYAYLYNPEPEMGTMFLAWSRNGVDGPSGYDNMFRLFFTSNENTKDPLGYRVYSLYDMKLSMTEEDYGLYHSSEVLPSTAQISAYQIDSIEIITDSSSASSPAPLVIVIAGLIGAACILCRRK